MQIKITSTDYEFAEKTLASIASHETALDGPDSDLGIIRWDALVVERGALDSIFEILGHLQLATVPVSIVCSVLANWLWEKIKHSQVKGKNSISIELVTSAEGTSIQLDCTSKESMTRSLESALTALKNQ